MQNIYFYPKLTDELLDACGCPPTKYKFTYSYQGQEFGLMQKGSSTIRISDPREIWKIETEGLILERTVKIAYPNLLYGKDGIACTGAEIGICNIGFAFCISNVAITGTIQDVYPISNKFFKQG